MFFTAQFQKSVCLCDSGQAVISRLSIAATAIHADVGEGGGTRSLENTVMISLIASLYALTLLGASSADAAIVGVHVDGIAVGVGIHGHGHHYHRRHYRRHH
jgi:hypothetical protein